MSHPRRPMCNLSNATAFQGRPIHWNPVPTQHPSVSGVYLTRNVGGQTWFKYFEADLGHWYMSWAELKANAPRTTARICGSEVAAQVAAWATCARRSA